MDVLKHFFPVYGFFSMHLDVVKRKRKQNDNDPLYVNQIEVVLCTNIITANVDYVLVQHFRNLPPHIVFTWIPRVTPVNCGFLLRYFPSICSFPNCIKHIFVYFSQFSHNKFMSFFHCWFSFSVRYIRQLYRWNSTIFLIYKCMVWRAKDGFSRFCVLMVRSDYLLLLLQMLIIHSSFDFKNAYPQTERLNKKGLRTRIQSAFHTNLIRMINTHEKRKWKYNAHTGNNHLSAMNGFLCLLLFGKGLPSLLYSILLAFYHDSSFALIIMMFYF